MRIFVAMLLLAGCASTRPAVGTGRATSTTQEFRRPDRASVWIVTVNNPTEDAVYVDCDELRICIPAHTQSDVLLVPDDQRCDLMNNETYAANPARLGHHWGPRWRVTVAP